MFKHPPGPARSAPSSGPARVNIMLFLANIAAVSAGQQVCQQVPGDNAQFLKLRGFKYIRTPAKNVGKTQPPLAPLVPAPLLLFSLSKPQMCVFKSHRPWIQIPSPCHLQEKTLGKVRQKQALIPCRGEVRSRALALESEPVCYPLHDTQPLVYPPPPPCMVQRCYLVYNFMRRSTLYYLVATIPASSDECLVS